MKYDVIVVGGGHAGCEAASSAARMGAKTALITHHFNTIGVMSCNPAIGGLGKGHLVREIDALDGLMAVVADQAGIQYRMLNRRKGPAVRGPRTQADRKLYKTAMQNLLRDHANLTIIEDEVVDLDVRDNKICGVELANQGFVQAGAVVLTTGTFLNGLIHIGDRNWPAGRMGEQPSTRLAQRLKGLNLPIGRLKTGTPARLNGKTIAWNELEMQSADTDPRPFSLLTDKITLPQIECGITRTSAQTHKVIRDNIHRSAMYSGAIEGIGPRYCPSIEDKIMRFGDRDGHQVFLEPEGLDDDTVYPNGLSTSLPEDVQFDYLRSMAGLHNVEVLQLGYAIEYDYFDPRCLQRSLEVKALSGLYFAGQINGTTGYEEAGAQGLVAGLNAARFAANMEPVIFQRNEAYLGVMIDDLVTRGVSEPYRMFTSRAEFRLSLRADNADERLTPKAIELGIASAKRQAAYDSRETKLNRYRDLLKSLNLTPNEAMQYDLQINKDGVRRSAYDLLAYNGITIEKLTNIWPQFADVDNITAEALEVEAQYAVYLDRQKQDMVALQREEQLKIPANLDLSAISGLSSELKSKLELRAPQSIAEAQRIDGMTPAALMLLITHIQRHKTTNKIEVDVAQ